MGYEMLYFVGTWATYTYAKESCLQLKMEQQVPRSPIYGVSICYLALQAKKELKHKIK